MKTDLGLNFFKLISAEELYKTFWSQDQSLCIELSTAQGNVFVQIS